MYSKVHVEAISGCFVTSCVCCSSAFYARFRGVCSLTLNSEIIFCWNGIFNLVLVAKFVGICAADRNGAKPSRSANGVYSLFHEPIILDNAKPSVANVRTRSRKFPQCGLLCTRCPKIPRQTCFVNNSSVPLNLLRGLLL